MKNSPAKKELHVKDANSGVSIFYFDLRTINMNHEIHESVEVLLLAG